MLSEIVAANKNYAVMEVNGENQLDETAIRVIRNDCPLFVQPIQLMNMDNHIQLRFELQGGIRLAYISMQMKKRELNRLLHQMVSPFLECADYFLDYHNIYLDRNYMMLNQSDYKVTYLYVPYEQLQNTEEDILKFLTDFIMEIDLQDEPAYITQLIRCVMGKGASIVSLMQLINENDTSEVKYTVAEPQPVPEKKIIQEPPKAVEKPFDIPKKEEIKKPDNSVQKEFGKNDISGMIGAELFGSADQPEKKKKEKEKKEGGQKSKGFLSKLLDGNKKSQKEEINLQQEISKEVKQNQTAPVEVPNIMQSVPNYEIESSETEIIDEVEQESSTDKLRLRLEKSLVEGVPDSIDIDLKKGYAVVGRYDKTGKLSADYNFDMSLTFIGRRHLRFERSGEEMYVIDLESKNHTYLNNEELLPNRRYEIHVNDRITITQKYGITYKVC